MGLVFAQDIESYDYNINDELYDYTESEDVELSGCFWISASLETANYSQTGLSYGGGLAFAYDKGVSIGFKTVYFFDFENKIDILELGFLLRFYLQGFSFCSGPFIQLSAGQALLFRREEVSLPAQWGIIYGSANFGWRFLLDKNYFIEPFIRGGYPFLFGGGLSAGIEF